MLAISPLRILACSFALLFLACSSPPSTRTVATAERFFANGRVASALHFSERAIQQDHEHPEERTISLHLKLLRELGRVAEAEAFREFTQRFASGEYAYTDETTPSRKKCEEWRVGNSLVSAWGNFDLLKRHDDYEIGTLATTFEIDHEGRLNNVIVLRAKHPAAAWLAITSIAQAKISKSRLAHFQEKHPDRFPFSLCAWWDYDEIDDMRPPNWRIRGFR